MRAWAASLFVVCAGAYGIMRRGGFQVYLQPALIYTTHITIVLYKMVRVLADHRPLHHGPFVPTSTLTQPLFVKCGDSKSDQTTGKYALDIELKAH